MKFGIRTPSIRKRVAARTSVKRYVRHSLGVKAPRGAGIITNPKKAVYNRVYNRTTMSVDDFVTPKKTNTRTNKQVSNENSNIFPVFLVFIAIGIILVGIMML